MMAFVAKNKKWLGYALYVVLITLALLYYLFPAQAFEEFANNSIRRIHTDLGFEAAGIGPSLPAGLQINNGRIFFRKSPGTPVFEAESMDIRPQILKLMRGDYRLDLAGTAYRGDLNGSLQAENMDGGSFDASLAFEDIDIAEYLFLTEKLPYSLHGKLNGDVIYAKDSAKSAAGGEADLHLTDGKLQFQNPIFGIGSFDLLKIDLGLQLNDTEVTVVKAELSSPEVKASMTGTIQLHSDINRSQLNLKGTLEPLAEFFKKYPEIRELLKSMKKRVKRGQYFFAITGTLGEPKLKML